MALPINNRPYFYKNDIVAPGWSDKKQLLLISHVENQTNDRCL